jgi:hypothetical protein
MALKKKKKRLKGAAPRAPAVVTAVVEAVLAGLVLKIP